MSAHGRAVLTTAATVACKFKGTVIAGNTRPVKLVVAGDPCWWRRGPRLDGGPTCAAQRAARRRLASVGAPTAGTSAKLW